jgi:hypothetical protein
MVSGNIGTALSIIFFTATTAMPDDKLWHSNRFCRCQAFSAPNHGTPQPKRCEPQIRSARYPPMTAAYVVSCNIRKLALPKFLSTGSSTTSSEAI